jgi:hypothetical protein
MAAVAVEKILERKNTTFFFDCKYVCDKKSGFNKAYGAKRVHEKASQKSQQESWGAFRRL